MEQESFDRVLATVLFTDIVDSTAMAATMGDAQWRQPCSRNTTGSRRAIIARFRGTVRGSTGRRLLRDVRRSGERRPLRRRRSWRPVKPLGIEIRAGLHTGEIELTEATTSPASRVHIGARVGAHGGNFGGLVSSTVKDLVAGSGLTFEDAGEHELKGVPDRWHLYRVAS